MKPTTVAPSRVLRSLLDVFAQAGRVAIFTARILLLAFRPPFFFREILHSTALVAARCVVPVVLTVGPFGMVVSLHGSSVFKMFGAERLIGMLIGITTLRELAPNLAGILVAAQAGSAFAAELATMRAQEEIDATLIMGVNPMKIHVIPRVFGITLGTPIVTVIGAAAGLLGGFLFVVVVVGQSPGTYLDNLFTSMTFFDVWSAVIKAGAFGLIIGLVACFLGFSAGGNTQDVGTAVNNTVVYSVTLFLLVNYFLSSALFGLVS